MRTPRSPDLSSFRKFHLQLCKICGKYGKSDILIMWWQNAAYCVEKPAFQHDPVSSDD